MYARAVVAQRVAQFVFNFALIALVFHVDKVDDDQAAEVAQPQLARDFFGRFQIGAEGGFFNVVAARGTRGVHIDGHQRFGVVDHNCAAGRQIHRSRMRGLDLMLDLEAREQRHVVVVVFDQTDFCRHHQRHEVLRLLVDIGGVDENLADFIVKIITDGAHHQIAFEINQERRGVQAFGFSAAFFRFFMLGLRRAVDGFPQLEQVIQIPLEFVGFAADGGGAGNHAHAAGDFQIVDDITQFVAVLTLDAARHAAAARIVRHQHQVAACQTDKGGERGAFAAALVLIHLNDDFLAFAQRFLDGGFADIDAGLEVGAGDFLERQKTVAFGAVIDKGGFETGLDAGDDALIDVALFLLFG